MHRLLAALAVFFAASALASSAAAQQGVDWLPVFVRASADSFGGGHLPTCGQPHFAWAADEEIAAGERGEERTRADNDPTTCSVRIAVRYWHEATIAQRCILVAHELGHLYGRPHSRNPLSIMYSSALDSLWWRWWTVGGPCRRAIVRTPQISPGGRLWYALSPGA